MAEPSGKRLRASRGGPHRLTDLPDHLLVEAAGYLAKPSRALFAVALTAPSTSWCTDSNIGRHQSGASRAILRASSWEDLDFSTIEKELAARLTDDDVGAVLACIDAKNHLKTLSLAGCVNISGSGLSILSGSTVLEGIDLSLVGEHESPAITPAPSISQDDIAPVLHSIVSADGCSLRYLFLPQKFRDIRAEPLMRQFLIEYDGYVGNNMICSSTDKSQRCRGFIDPGPNDNLLSPYLAAGFYNLQDTLCGGCKRYFCLRCQEDDFVYCANCQRYFCPECDTSGEETCQVEHCISHMCKECGEMNVCKKCNKRFCGGQCSFFCEYCNEPICEECIYNQCHWGRRCEIGICTPCAEGYNDDPDGTPDSCKVCGNYMCKKHKYLKCSKNWAEACQGCVQMILPANIASTVVEEGQKLQRENESLREEVESLRRRLGELGYLG